MQLTENLYLHAQFIQSRSRENKVLLVCRNFSIPLGICWRTFPFRGNFMGIFWRRFSVASTNWREMDPMTRSLYIKWELRNGFVEDVWKCCKLIQTSTPKTGLKPVMLHLSRPVVFIYWRRNADKPAGNTENRVQCEFSMSDNQG